MTRPPSPPETTQPGAPHTARSSAGAKPVNKMKMAMVNTPLAMRVLPLAPSVGSLVRDAHCRCVALAAACRPRRLLPAPHSRCPFAFSLEDMAPASNKTEDQVKHLLLVRSPAPTPTP